MIILSMHNSGRHKLHTQPVEEALFEDVVTWRCDPTLWEGQEWLRSHWAELQLNTQSRQHLTRVLLRSAAPTTQTPSGWAARWEGKNKHNKLSLFVYKHIYTGFMTLITVIKRWLQAANECCSILRTLLVGINTHTKKKHPVLIE